jgi:hypothetical protein
MPKLKLPTTLDAAFLEEANARLQTPTDEVTLDLSSWQESRLLAEARLLGLCGVQRRQGRDLRLTISTLPKYTPDTTNRLWRLFLDTNAGMILGQLASSAIDREGIDQIVEIRRCQAKLMRSQSGVIGYGKERSLPVVDIFGGPPSADAISKVRGDPRRFAGLLQSNAAAVGLDPNELQVTDLDSLIKFAYETFENTWHHGATDLDSRPIDGLRFVGLRRLNLQQEPLTDLFAGANGAVSEFLKALSRSDGADLLRKERLVELTVADSGVGIAARLTRSLDIYQNDVQSERDVVQSAFEVGTSSRDEAYLGKGFGLPKALAAARALRGFVSVRTGRLQLAQEFATPNASSTKRWQVHEHALLAGTSITLLFIWRNSAARLFEQPT